MLTVAIYEQIDYTSPSLQSSTRTDKEILTIKEL